MLIFTGKKLWDVMNTDIAITINQTIIVYPNKFLGIIIDDKLSWKAHIKHL